MPGQIPPWILQVEGFVFIGVGVFMKWRGLLGSDSAALTGLRAAVFTLMLPASLLRSTWTKTLEGELLELLLWSVAIHIFWVGCSYLLITMLFKHGWLPIGGELPGWYLLTMSATSLGMPYAFMGQGDFGERAIPSAVLYDLGGNTWLCQVGFAFLGSIGASEVAPRRSSAAADAELPAMTELAQAPPKSALRSGSSADPTAVSGGPLQRERAARPKSARVLAPEDAGSTEDSSSLAVGDADQPPASAVQIGPERLIMTPAAASMCSDVPRRSRCDVPRRTCGDVPRRTRLSRVRLTVANIDDAVVEAHGVSTVAILRDNILLNPVIVAFVFGCSMNVLGVSMPLILDDVCDKLTTSFSCMMYFMIGSCIELRRPSWSDVSPAFIALALRTCLQLVTVVLFPVVLMIYGRRLLTQDEIDFDLRRAFTMCMLSPCTNMIMFWSGQYSHSADLSAFYITLSNLFSMLSLGGASAFLLKSEFGSEQPTATAAFTHSTAS
ncbi:unnamed protein product [Prorocentrum cordatum]|uniref:Transporter n=1 Tax=Prorocentrum cordatum TaxID=2364126 RepID=A0ABN9PAP3_9DINO|nr:unnamed protein product [Polarella glacialis]